MKAPVVILLVAVVTLAGDYLLKLASQREQSFACTAFVVGALLYAATAVGWVVAMKHMTLAAAGVWFSIAIILMLTGLGIFVFGERLTAREGLGLVLAFAALGLMSRFA